MVIWEFDPPPGETFRLSFDARIEPGVQWGRDADDRGRGRWRRRHVDVSNLGVALMELVLRTVVVYVLLWAVIRGTGKRELAELGPFDLVLLIVLGDVVQQAVTQEDMSITGGLHRAGDDGTDRRRHRPS